MVHVAVQAGIVSKQEKSKLIDHSNCHDDLLKNTGFKSTSTSTNEITITTKTPRLAVLINTNPF